MERAYAEGRTSLDEVDAKELIRGWGIPAVPTRLATNAPEAARIAGELGWPAVLKLVSPDVVHKTDVDGVRLRLADGAAVERAFGDLRAGAVGRSIRFAGVAVQPMARPGLELLLGAYRDPQFGPIISVGMGGVLVEVHEDVALRVAPLRDFDAADMVGELRAARLLAGHRGAPPVDRGAIERALLALSALMIARRELAELDLNPVLGFSEGVLAVDARVILTPRD